MAVTNRVEYIFFTVPAAVAQLDQSSGLRTLKLEDHSSRAVLSKHQSSFIYNTYAEKRQPSLEVVMNRHEMK